MEKRRRERGRKKSGDVWDERREPSGGQERVREPRDDHSSTSGGLGLSGSRNTTWVPKSETIF